MKNVNIKRETLEAAVKFLGYEKTEKTAVMKMRDGSEMTTTLYIFKDPTGVMFINISGISTKQFDDVEEFDRYLEKKFKIYKSEKEMYINWYGMDEETWEEWNKAE